MVEGKTIEKKSYTFKFAVGDEDGVVGLAGGIAGHLAVARRGGMIAGTLPRRSGTCSAVGSHCHGAGRRSHRAARLCHRHHGMYRSPEAP